MKDYYTGETLTFDGFGNKSGGYAVDPGTNRIIGFSYDANGNPGGPTWDIENRMVANLNDSYGYAADNRRVYRRREISGGVFQEEIYFWGLDGRMGTYKMQGPSGALTLVRQEENVYFGGRVIFKRGLTADTTMFLDRAGTVAGRKTSGGTERNYYYPWGEERSATANEREKFGTYFRDGNGIDYADQRYYQSQYGRFMTADPYKASGKASSPLSWNRYAYVHGDPVNFADSRGLEREYLGSTSAYCATGQVDPEGSPLYVSCDLHFFNNVSTPRGGQSTETRIGGGGEYCDRAKHYSGLLDEDWDSFFDDVSMDSDEQQELFGGSDIDPKASSTRDAVPAFAVAAASAANWVVYWARTPQGQYYIGVTSNFAARQAAHVRNGLNPIVISMPKLNYASAKGVEQLLIENLRSQGASLLNKINSISPKSRWYDQFTSWGQEILNKCSSVPGELWPQP
jgi:RHS repeat-associated protein